MITRLLTLTTLLSFLSLFGEEVVRMEKPVPNRLLRQGEAQLIQNGSRVGVRIKLHTRHLTKVQEKIQQGEAANWPGSSESKRYLQNLNALCDEVLAASKGKVNFSIEWMLEADGSGKVKLQSSESKRVLSDLSPEYLKKNLALIMADNFDFSEAEALDWIQDVRNAAEKTP